MIKTRPPRRVPIYCPVWQMSSSYLHRSGPRRLRPGVVSIVRATRRAGVSLVMEREVELFTDGDWSFCAVTMAASERVGFEPVVTVVDSSGNLNAFERSDRSSYLAVNIASDKAYTATSFGPSTAQWVDLLEDRGASNLRHVPRGGRFSAHGRRRNNARDWHLRRKLGARPGSGRGSPPQFRQVTSENQNRRHP